jgi:hypothetical protein
VKFSIIVDILLTFHMMRRHITGNEASQAVGMLQAGQVQRACTGLQVTLLYCKHVEENMEKLHSYLFWKQFKNMILNFFCSVYNTPKART